MTLEEEFTAYRDDVYRLALSYTKSPQEAQDVCQTVFLKRMEARITPGKEKAWLLQVTANTCRSLLRSAWWRQSVPLDETVPAPAGADGTVYQALMTLPPKYRVVLYLRYYAGYSTREIARLLHITPTAVTTRLDRARKQLRMLLEEEVYE